MTRGSSSAVSAAGAALILAIASCSAPKVQSPEQDASLGGRAGSGGAGGSGGSAGAAGGSGGTGGTVDGAAGAAGDAEGGLDASDAPSDACAECPAPPTPGECVLGCDPDGLLKFRFQNCTCSTDAGMCGAVCQGSKWCDSSAADAPTDACVRCIRIWVEEPECADPKLSCFQSATCRPALECLSGCGSRDN